MDAKTCVVDGTYYVATPATDICKGCVGEWGNDPLCYELEDCVDVIWIKDDRVPNVVPPTSDNPLGFGVPASAPAAETVRAFNTGATRSSDAGRYDPEGFMSPIVVERFAQYMNKHRVQPDGSIRSSDNWQKGIPRDAYMKGMWRHFLHLWTRHRGFKVQDPLATDNIEEDLCSILFNASGMLFEILKDKPEIKGDA